MSESVVWVNEVNGVIPYCEIEKLSITDECFADNRRWMRPTHPAVKQFTLLPSRLNTCIRNALGLGSLPAIYLSNSLSMSHEQAMKYYG